MFFLSLIPISLSFLMQHTTPISTVSETQMHNTMNMPIQKPIIHSLADSLDLLPVVVVGSSVGVALSERDAVFGVEGCCTVGDG